MRSAIYFRYACLLSAAMLILVCAPARAVANEIGLLLDVRYNTPTDMSSGGSWELAAKSDALGIYGLRVLLTGIESVTAEGPTGSVNTPSDAAGFSELDSHDYGNYLEVVLGQVPVWPLGGGDEQSLFYGVGTTLANAPNYAGKPVGSTSIGPVFTSLTPAGISWALAPEHPLAGDPDWSTAAILLSGTFPAGPSPDFDFFGAGSGNVFTSLPPDNYEVGTRSVASVTTELRTNFIEGLLGDYNQNDIVDAADYTKWRDVFSVGGTDLPNDPTPGTVDETDFDYWKAHFGQTAPPGSGAGAGQAALATGVAVPEPASWILLAAAGMLFFRRSSLSPFGRRPG